jgi:hypothetical protein
MSSRPKRQSRLVAESRIEQATGHVGSGAGINGLEQYFVGYVEDGESEAVRERSSSSNDGFDMKLTFLIR